MSASSLHPARWEYGSQLHAVAPPARSDRGPRPWGSDALMLGCGRDALRLILPRFERLWMPSYLCQEVVRAAASGRASVRCYPDSPLQAAPAFDVLPLRAGDAVYVVDYFGLRASVPRPPTPGITWIEDHTHDPCSDWAHASRADYCLASFRKLFPLPDGGVLWSPRGHALPQTPAIDATSS